MDLPPFSLKSAGETNLIQLQFQVWIIE